MSISILNGKRRDNRIDNSDGTARCYKVELIEYLSVPYTLQVQSVFRETAWKRRLCYPELPDCVVEHDSIWDGLILLDRMRVRIIVKMYRDGETIPVPRSPLRNHDAIAELRDLGLLAEIESEFPLRK